MLNTGMKITGCTNITDSCYIIYHCQWCIWFSCISRWGVVDMLVFHHRLISHLSFAVMWCRGRKVGERKLSICPCFTNNWVASQTYSCRCGDDYECCTTIWPIQENVGRSSLFNFQCGMLAFNRFFNISAITEYIKKNFMLIILIVWSLWYSSLSQMGQL